MEHLTRTLRSSESHFAQFRMRSAAQRALRVLRMQTQSSAGCTKDARRALNHVRTLLSPARLCAENRPDFANLCLSSAHAVVASSYVHRRRRTRRRGAGYSVVGQRVREPVREWDQHVSMLFRVSDGV